MDRRKSLGGPKARLTTNNRGGGMANPQQSQYERLPMPVLPPAALVSCMTDVQPGFTLDDLQRPNAGKVIQTFEAILDLCMGQDRDDCSLESVAAMDIVDNPELFVDPARFFVFLQQLSSLMYQIGVPDVTSRDLTKPETERLRRLYSAAINFAKFREDEDRQARFVAELQKSDGDVESIVEAERDFDEKQSKLEELRAKLEAQGPEVEELKAFNFILAQKMEELKLRESKMTERREELRKERKALLDEKSAVADKLKAKKKLLDEVTADVVEMPAEWPRRLQDLPKEIQQLREDIEQKEAILRQKRMQESRSRSILEEIRPVQEMTEITLQAFKRKNELQVKEREIKMELDHKHIELESLEAKKAQLLELTAKQTLNHQQFKESAKAQLDELDNNISEGASRLEEKRAKLKAAQLALEERKRRIAEIEKQAGIFKAEYEGQRKDLINSFEEYHAELIKAGSL